MLHGLFLFCSWLQQQERIVVFVHWWCRFDVGSPNSSCHMVKEVGTFFTNRVNHITKHPTIFIKSFLERTRRVKKT